MCMAKSLFSYFASKVVCNLLFKLLSLICIEPVPLPAYTPPSPAVPASVLVTCPVLTKSEMAFATFSAIYLFPLSSVMLFIALKAEYKSACNVAETKAIYFLLCIKNQKPVQLLPLTAETLQYHSDSQYVWQGFQLLSFLLNHPVNHSVFFRVLLYCFQT